MAFPCPFVYANGKRCTGHIERIQAYKCDLEYRFTEQGDVSLVLSEPRTHYHLFCSLRGNHAGYKRHDDWRMKFYFSQLPQGIRDAIDGPWRRAERGADGGLRD